MPDAPSLPSQAVALLGNIRELLGDVMAVSDTARPTISSNLVDAVYETIIEIDRAMETLR